MVVRCVSVCVLLYVGGGVEKLVKHSNSLAPLFGNLLFSGSGGHQKSYFKGHSTIEDFDANLIKNKTQINGASCMQQVFWLCL